MTASREVRISADPAVPLIRLEREFDADPAAVFRAHTDPDLYRRWVGPARLTTTIDRWDCRDGGEFRFVQTDGEGEYAFRGCFHQVVPDELIVQTFTWEAQPDGVSLEKLRFVAVAGGRTLLASTSLVDSFEDRDRWLRSGLETGLAEGYAKLDALLHTP